jgi:hypothetical protein
MQSFTLAARVSLVLVMLTGSGAQARALDEVPGWGAPVAGDQLGDYRGGFDAVQNDMQLNGSVANNVTSNVASGHNIITEGSFTNANGFPMVIQNSGSNVLIQNATIINLQYQ